MPAFWQATPAVQPNHHHHHHQAHPALLLPGRNLHLCHMACRLCRVASRLCRVASRRCRVASRRCRVASRLCRVASRLVWSVARFRSMRANCQTSRSAMMRMGCRLLLPSMQQAGSLTQPIRSHAACTAILRADATTGRSEPFLPKTRPTKGSSSHRNQALRNLSTCSNFCRNHLAAPSATRAEHPRCF